MKYLIVCGSDRTDSNSMKISELLQKDFFSSLQDESKILDFKKNPLEMWSEDMWDSESEQKKKWAFFEDLAKEADGIVVVAPEWEGQLSPMLKNFMMHLNFSCVAHKPALIVSVSAGMGGTYPIAELRAFSAKNSGLLYIPDHIIVRNVKSFLNPTKEEVVSQQELKKRIEHSTNVLKLYAKHMKNMRDEADFDFSNYPYGM